MRRFRRTWVLAALAAAVGCKVPAKPKPIPPPNPPLPARDTPPTTQRVGKIVIEGNDLTDRRVILNQLGFAPGDDVDAAGLAVAQANLVRIGIFDQAEPPTVAASPADPATGVCDVRVRVKETRTGVVTLGPGVNSRPLYVTPAASSPASVVECGAPNPRPLGPAAAP